MPNRAAAMILASALISSTGASAATLTTVLTEKGVWIAIRGDIIREDADALENMLQRADLNGRSISGVQLDSPGGNLLGGIRLARVVRSHAVLTAVGRAAACNSACFLVLAAGHQKFVDYASRVGIHAVADKQGRITEETEAATRAMARFCEELGVPRSVTRKLIGTPPDQIVWLSVSDLRSMGVAMTGQQRTKRPH